jgi:hypothetical protein
VATTTFCVETHTSNIGSYDEVVRGFDWALAERELGWGQGHPFNIGWHLAGTCQ